MYLTVGVPSSLPYRSYVTTSGEHDSYDWDSGLRVVSDAIESVGAAVTSGLASLAQVRHLGVLAYM